MSWGFPGMGAVLAGRVARCVRRAGRPRLPWPPGSHGWFLPKLRQRLGPFAATLVLFPVWLFWHRLTNATRGVALAIAVFAWRRSRSGSPLRQ